MKEKECEEQIHFILIKEKKSGSNQFPVFKESYFFEFSKKSQQYGLPLV